MHEAQYFKRQGQSVSIIHILAGQDGSKYFANVSEHRGWEGHTRDSAQQLTFPDKGTMDAHIAAFTAGLLNDGYQEI